VKFDRDKFFAAYRLAYPSRLSQSQVDGLNTLLSSIESDTHLTDIRHVAYMLATVKHECADRWQPIVERGSRSYFDKYEPNTSLGKRLGNRSMGDGFRTRGRGYVMITGLANYERMNRVLDLAGTDHDLVINPDVALIPEISYAIMSFACAPGPLRARSCPTTSTPRSATTPMRGASSTAWTAQP
jgi:putative chitinase